MLGSSVNVCNIESGPCKLQDLVCYSVATSIGSDVSRVASHLTAMNMSYIKAS